MPPELRELLSAELLPLELLLPEVLLTALPDSELLPNRDEPSLDDLPLLLEVRSARLDRPDTFSGVARDTELELLVELLVELLSRVRDDLAESDDDLAESDDDLAESDDDLAESDDDDAPRVDSAGLDPAELDDGLIDRADGVDEPAELDAVDEPGDRGASCAPIEPPRLLNADPRPAEPESLEFEPPEPPPSTPDVSPPTVLPTVFPSDPTVPPSAEPPSEVEPPVNTLEPPVSDADDGATATCEPA